MFTILTQLAYMFENVIPVTVSPPEYDSSNGFSAGDNDGLGTLSVDFQFDGFMTGKGVAILFSRI